MSEERQSVFGWLIAVELFLSGAGGATFLISFILDFIGKYEAIARIGAISGPVLAGVGSLLLMAELGSRTGVYRLFANISSWMSRGTWILTIFIILGLAYSLPAFWTPWVATPLGRGVGIVAALFSLLAVIYPGFLFGAVRSVPFWNTPALPPTFLFWSLSTGVAVFLLIASLSAKSLAGETLFALHSLGTAAVVLIIIQLLVLGAYIEIGRHSSIAFARSVRLLIAPLPIGGVLAMGLLIPLGLLASSLAISDVYTLSILGIVASILMLVGGLFLRYSIINAGVYLPVSLAS